MLIELFQVTVDESGIPADVGNIAFDTSNIVTLQETKFMNDKGDRLTEVTLSCSGYINRFLVSLTIKQILSRINMTKRRD